MTEDILPGGEVRAELLLPHEIEAALARRSVAYVPLGSLEHHSHHLPIGLDGLTAHGICVRAAARAGGIVLPTTYAAVGGDHTGYPWTVMLEDPAPLRALLTRTLERLDDVGVETAVLFTGHFADQQLGLVDEVAEEWGSSGRALRVLPLAVNRSGAAVPPDHAGRFETSLLAALHPDRVHLERLAPPEEAAAQDRGHAGGYAHRHDPGHPLWAVMGPDPRPLDPAAAADLLEHLVGWTLQQVQPAADRAVPEGGLHR